MIILLNRLIGYQLYSEKCVQEGVVTAEEVKQIYDNYQKICDESFDEAQKETSMKVLSSLVKMFC